MLDFQPRKLKTLNRININSSLKSRACTQYYFHHVTIYVSLCCSPSLPALDWQLPSCSGPYNLQIEVQPKSHHRAHYETEGSRGAVKALSGGHPVVQVCVPAQQMSIVSDLWNSLSAILFAGDKVCLCVFKPCNNLLSLQCMLIQVYTADLLQHQATVKFRLIYQSEL